MSKEFQYIIKKTGRKPVECKCNQCKSQCSTVPCLGTPSDILRLMDNGFAQHIWPTDWYAGMAIGTTDHPIPMFQLDNVPGHGCALFKDGLCTIHTTGMKPTEGKLSSHVMQHITHRKKSISWQVAKTWEDPANASIIAEITRKNVNK